MKLLFDQNLSPRLVRNLSDIYPASAHVSELDLASALDSVVWDHARDNAYLIVSRDSDFSDMSLLRGFPPKVIWIRRGNCPTREIVSILRRAKDLVEGLMRDENQGMLLLY